MKYIVFIFFLLSAVSNASVLVIKASKNIAYKERITISNVYSEYINNLKRSCSPITKDMLKNNPFRAKMILKKGRILCKKDLYMATKNRLVFNFGSIEIEKDGKIIKETNRYIRIRNIDGKIENIYKNGNY